jgi:hypothetical protein
MEYWSDCTFDQFNNLIDIGDCYLVHNDPILYSPEYIGISVPPSVPHFVVYEDGRHSVSQHISMPEGATFMKPRLDTILFCHALRSITYCNVSRVAEVGAGSGFISKYFSNICDANIDCLDIDPKSREYIESSTANMPNSIVAVTCEAISYIKNAIPYDVILCNPPYVPTVAETKMSDILEMEHNYWSGTALMSLLISEVMPICKEGILIMGVSSASFKSKSFVSSMNQHLNSGGFEVLYSKEIAYKAWYVGGENYLDHIISNETNEKIIIGDFEFDYGVSNNASPRTIQLNDGRLKCNDYYWQTFYVIKFYNNIDNEGKKHE